MARLEDLREELEQFGKEIEEAILRARGHRSCTSAHSGETPINIQLTIPRDVHRLQISISIERSDDDAQ